MHSLPRRRARNSALVTFIVAPALGWSQTSVTPRFEVASVRSHRPDRSLPSGTQNPGSLVLRDVTLRSLVQLAWRVLGYQLIAPNWMDSERFDVSALKPPGAKEDMVPEMLQRLLEERFSLQVHHESRSIQANALVQGKAKLKLTRPVDEGTARISFGPHTIRGKSSSLAALAAGLSRWTDEQVVDLTGLQGAFDFDLNWTPEENQPRPSSADLSAALESQLGLKLESRKLPLDFLIVDHAEKAPAEN